MIGKYYVGNVKYYVWKMVTHISYTEVSVGIA
jgi:hypothetical protein